MNKMKMSHSIVVGLVFIILCGGTDVGLTQSTTDRENILFLKQEEKLARDVYETMYDQWGHQTFLNISASERRHMDAVDGLIARYGLTDTTPEARGEFTIPALQTLYNEWVASGSQSLEEALKVGVAIEVLDIEHMTQK